MSIIFNTGSSQSAPENLYCRGIFHITLRLPAIFKLDALV